MPGTLDSLDSSEYLFDVDELSILAVGGFSLMLGSSTLEKLDDC